jgi:hypothetical protein
MSEALVYLQRGGRRAGTTNAALPNLKKTGVNAHIGCSLRKLRDQGFLRNMQADWYAESLRLTFFALPTWTQRALFAEVVGTPASEQVSRPLQNFHQESGSAFGRHLIVGQTPGRIDFILSDNPTPPVFGAPPLALKDFFWIGELKESISLFDQIIGRAAISVGGALRVAYAITLLRQTETARGAIGILKEQLPTVDFDPQNDADLVYQINHPRLSRTGRKTNRLARWEAIQSGTVQLGLGAMVPVSMSPLAFAARVHIDVNTDADNKVPIADQELADVIAELRSMAVEIAERGDSK